LRTDITQFLSPWAFRSDRRPSFNGRISKAVLIDFLDERTYVDYVTDVKLYLPTTAGDGPDHDDVTGSKAISIPVSVPARQHGVSVIHPTETLATESCACAPKVPS
jgi:hypothetical protein